MLDRDPRATEGTEIGKQALAGIAFSRHHTAKASRILLVAFAVGFLSGLAILNSKEASAVDCSTEPELNVIMNQDDGFHRGNATWGPGMRTADTEPGVDPTCERVSTIYVFRNTQQFVELGWYEVGPIQGVCGFTDGNPRLLAIWNSFCEYTIQNIANSGNHGWRIDNADNNNTFDYYYEGVKKASTPNVGFPGGWAMAGTERTGFFGAMAGEFNTLFFQDSSGWNSWDDSSNFCDNDPEFKSVKHAQDWWEVIRSSQGSNACPGN